MGSGPLRESYQTLSKNTDSFPPLNEPLHELERELIDDAFKNIVDKGVEVLMTEDTQVYASDSAQSDPKKVFLLLSKEGMLKEITPLYRFANPILVRAYEDKRKALLSN